MSLSRTHSRTDINNTPPTVDTNKNLALPGNVVTDATTNVITNTSTGAKTGTAGSIQASSTASPAAPKMKLKMPVQQSADQTKNFEPPERTVPQSPRTLKSPRHIRNKSETSTVSTSPRSLTTSTQPTNEETAPKVNHNTESPRKTALTLNTEPTLNAEPTFNTDKPLSSEPTFQVRRTHEALASSPRKLILPSSASSASSNPSAIHQGSIHQSASMPTSVPTPDDAPAALLGLILKEYQAKPITPEMVKVLGREDVYFAVKALPKALTHLTEFPDNGISSISELLISLYGGEVRHHASWKKVESAILNGQGLDDGSVTFGEIDAEIKKKYGSLLKPLALIIADSILGKDKTIQSSVLPAGLLKLLFEGDKKLLDICVSSTKLRVKEMNNARLHFLFNMVVTRFVQVMIMEKFPQRPSQVETWFQSEILEALATGITALSDEFLKQSNQHINKELMDKFRGKAAAEIREDEAIRQFKQMQLTQTRISELKQKEKELETRRKHERGGKLHSRASSFVELSSMKLERDNRKALSTIKTECGFDEMDAHFLKFIEQNQSSWFQGSQKISRSNTLMHLKLAVRAYLEMQYKPGTPPDQKVTEVFQKLDALLSAEFEVRQKRRTTAFSKDIQFTVNLNKNIARKMEVQTPDETASTTSSTSATASTTSAMASSTTATASTTSATASTTSSTASTASSIASENLPNSNQ